MLKGVVAGLSLVFLFLAGSSHALNCMWDDSCEDEKYNVGFCGNGYCEHFESKESCVDDCGSIADLLVDKVRSFMRDAGGGGSGPFGSIIGSSVAMLLVFIVAVIFIVVFGVLLMAVYGRIVESVERDTP